MSQRLQKQHYSELVAGVDPGFYRVGEGGERNFFRHRVFGVVLATQIPPPRADTTKTTLFQACCFLHEAIRW